MTECLDGEKQASEPLHSLVLFLDLRGLDGFVEREPIKGLGFDVDASACELKAAPIRIDFRGAEFLGRYMVSKEGF